MSIEFALTEEDWNTSYAPLAALCVHYQQHQVLKPLQDVHIPLKTRVFMPVDKLMQVYLSILAGCETLVEVNTKLRPEQDLAKLWYWQRFAEQSSLARTLDALTQMNLKQLRTATTTIWRKHSQVRQHDLRVFLWLDFDLSGLPCGSKAEGSEKGYFSGKKTSKTGNWLVSALSLIEKPSGPSSMPAISTQSVV